MTSSIDSPVSDLGHSGAFPSRAWDEFLASQPSACFMQSSWWADVMLSRGYSHFGVVLQDGDCIVGGCQVLTKRGRSGPIDYHAPEGPVLPQGDADAAEVFHAVMAFIDQKRLGDGVVVSHLNIEPRWEKLPGFVADFRQRSSWAEPRKTLCIDLTAPEATMFARMKPKGRYNIKVATRHNVSVVEDISSQGLQDFLRLYDTTIDRHNLDHRLSTAFFEQLIGKFNAIGCGSIFFAEYGGERIAAALVIYFGNRATYYAGGSLAIHREVMAPYLLHFRVMLKAKELGHYWYDMYGIAPESEADNKWAGFSAFKRKLGGIEVNFVPSMDYIYERAAYEQSG